MNSLFFVCSVISSLSNRDDDDGVENVAKKYEFASFATFIASVWTRSIFQMWAFFPGVES